MTVCIKETNISHNESVGLLEVAWNEDRQEVTYCRNLRSFSIVAGFLTFSVSESPQELVAVPESLSYPSPPARFLGPLSCLLDPNPHSLLPHVGWGGG